MASSAAMAGGATGSRTIALVLLLLVVLACGGNGGGGFAAAAAVFTGCSFESQEEAEAFEAALLQQACFNVTSTSGSGGGGSEGCRGVYQENVEVRKKKTNIVIVGEGMGETVITGSRSMAGGWTTFRSATFAVSGAGFIARDVTIRNTAGPAAHQAVALRVDSDRSAFFRVAVEGHQDTLYAHSLRQFYRDCRISGTVDFVFGNGVAVIQRTTISTLALAPGQTAGSVTAQGRRDPNQNTGFSLHNCVVEARFPTYLGRPWKPFSRVVVMESYLGAGVQAQGWMEWDGDAGGDLATLFYGEYRNYGPGANVGGRVRWPGYHVIMDAAVAARFTVRRVIDGLAWLPSTGVTFTADLIRK
uniref:Pectinesterase n=1 Tax=Oryza brachyantha TaxID=4533 RepID=J3KYD7_ORYBR